MLLYYYVVGGTEHNVRGDRKALDVFKDLLDSLGTGDGEGLGFYHMSTGGIETVPTRRSPGKRQVTKEDLHIKCTENDPSTKVVNLTVTLAPSAKE